FEQPEGVQIVKEIKAAYIDPEDDLFTDTQYYILTISYTPIACSLQVHRHNWILMKQCNSAKWNIHGLWGADKSNAKRRKAMCFSDVYRGDPKAYVTDLKQIPLEYQKDGFPISGNFNNNLKAFETYSDYFEFASKAYSELNLKNNLTEANLIPSDTELYDIDRLNDVISRLPFTSVVTKVPFYGSVVAVREIQFCYDLDRNMIIVVML
ncbi:hypothetical protein B4U80_12205, partial [Leptotrombidium deliense]